MSENGHRVFARLIFIGRKASSQRRLDSQNIQEISGDQKTLDALRCFQAGKVRAPPTIETHLLEGLILRTPIEVIGHRSFVAYYSATWLRFPDRDYAIELRKGQRLDEQCVDDAEDGAVGANADGQRDDGDDRERRTSHERPDAVTDVF